MSILLPRKTILLVDDEADTRDARSLDPDPIPCLPCFCVRTMDAALEVIRQELPNLMLLDLMMPELDGFGVLDAMRTDESMQYTGCR
jgi:CheY-like chemotaxis protein